MRITSLVAKLSGLITFNDNTTSSFHSQLESDISWSENQTEGLESTRQVSWFYEDRDYPFWDALIVAIQHAGIPNFEYNENGPRPTVQKHITDMVARMDFILTMNDGHTYHFATVATGKTDLLTITPGFTVGDIQLTNAGDIANFNRYLIEVENMFSLIMDDVVVA